MYKKHKDIKIEFLTLNYFTINNYLKNLSKYEFSICNIISIFIFNILKKVIVAYVFKIKNNYSNMVCFLLFKIKNN